MKELVGQVESLMLFKGVLLVCETIQKRDMEYTVHAASGKSFQLLINKARRICLVMFY